MDERIFLQVSQCLFKVVYGVPSRDGRKELQGYLPVSGLPQGHIGEKVHESFEDAHVALRLAVRMAYQRNILILQAALVVRLRTS